MFLESPFHVGLGYQRRKARQRLTFSGSLSIGFATIRPCRKGLGTGRDFPFNFLIEARKEFAHCSLKNRFVRQGGRQTRFANESLVAAHFGSVLGSQEKCHFVLGKSQAFSIRSQIIWKLRRSHGCGHQGTPGEFDLHNIVGYSDCTAGTFAGSGNSYEKPEAKPHRSMYSQAHFSAFVNGQQSCRA